MYTQGDRSLERCRAALGVGLTLVRNLVDLHEGTVEARSAGPGQGSEFIVNCRSLAPTRLPRLALSKTPSSRSPPSGGVSWLSTTIRISFRAWRDCWRCSDTRFTSPTTVPARGGCRGGLRPGSALLDIGLPGINGYDVARRIREQPEIRRVVLVAQTGWGQEEDRRRSREAGFDYHIVKPLEIGVLKQLLAALPRKPDLRVEGSSVIGGWQLAPEDRRAPSPRIFSKEIRVPQSAIRDSPIPDRQDSRNRLEETTFRLLACAEAFHLHRFMYRPEGSVTDSPRETCHHRLIALSGRDRWGAVYGGDLRRRLMGPGSRGESSGPRPPRWSDPATSSSTDRAKSRASNQSPRRSWQTASSRCDSGPGREFVAPAGVPQGRVEPAGVEVEQAERRCRSYASSAERSSRRSLLHLRHVSDHALPGAAGRAPQDFGSGGIGSSESGSVMDV